MTISMTLFRISNKSAMNDSLNYDVFYLTFAEIRSHFNLLSSRAFVKRYVDEAQHNDNTVNMHHKLYIRYKQKTSQRTMAIQILKHLACQLNTYKDNLTCLNYLLKNFKLNGNVDFPLGM